MKRAIFVLIFLTIVVALPPFYLQWAESQRLSQIQKVKQQARPIFGDRLETVLSELKSSEPPSVLSYIRVAQKAIWSHAGVIKSSRVDYRGALTLWSRFGSMDSPHSWSMLETSLMGKRR